MSPRPSWAPEVPLPDAPAPFLRSDRAFTRVLLALVCAGLSTFGLLYCVQPLLPLFAADFRLDATAASLAVSAATAALAVGLLFASALSDRLGRKPVMTAALYVAAGLTLLVAAAPSWPLLVLLRGLSGLVLAGAPAVAMAYVADELDAEAAGLAMGLYIAGTALGGVLRCPGGFVTTAWRGVRAARLAAASVPGTAGS